jgi:hypothetical protein
MNSGGSIESERREVEKLFFRIANASDSETRARLFEELASHLAIYAVIEGRTAGHSWRRYGPPFRSLIEGISTEPSSSSLPNT